MANKNPKQVAQLVASTTPGNCWSVDCYRDSGGRIIVFAQEGRRKVRQYMGRPAYSWETVIGMGAGGGDRRYRYQLEAKRLTQGVWDAGVAKMIADLKANGLARDGEIEVIDEGVLA